MELSVENSKDAGLLIFKENVPPVQYNTGIHITKKGWYGDGMEMVIHLQ